VAEAHTAQVLFVCMGNICRSPIAEGICQALARDMSGLKVRADSAGTHDYHIGEAPDRRAQQVAARHGIDISMLRARQLTPQDFVRFDLILVMDEQNRRDALKMASTDARARLRLLLEFAPELRVREVADPYYGGPAEFEATFQLATLGVRGLLTALKRADASA
jgi:protein-tyrosine phosphatase